MEKTAESTLKNNKIKPKKLKNPKYWIQKVSEDIKESLQFIRQYGNSNHAFVDNDEFGNLYLPAVISFRDCPDDKLTPGDFLVCNQEDGNTYLYTRAEVEAGLKLFPA